MRRLSIAALMVLLVGCSTFTPQEAAQFDFGPYPHDYKDIVQRRLAGLLKDPSSAIIEFRAGPTQVWQGSTLFSAKDYGWGVCLWINAKNSYGGYVGRRPYAYLIRNGAIVQAHGEMETNMFDTALAQGMCKSAGAS